MEQIPARAAKYGEPIRPLSAPVQAALAAKGITRLFSHQAQALNAVLSGLHPIHRNTWFDCCESLISRRCRKVIQGMLFTVRYGLYTKTSERCWRCRQGCCGVHSHSERQISLLQPPHFGGSGGEPLCNSPVHVSHQGPRPGPAARPEGVLRSCLWKQGALHGHL